MTIRAIYRDNGNAGFVRQSRILYNGVYSIRNSKEPALKLPFKVEGDVVTFPPSKLGVEERIIDESFTGNVCRPTDGEVVFRGPGERILHRIDLTVERHDGPVAGLPFCLDNQTHCFRILRER